MIDELRRSAKFVIVFLGLPALCASCAPSSAAPTSLPVQILTFDQEHQAASAHIAPWCQWLEQSTNTRWIYAYDTEAEALMATGTIAGQHLYGHVLALEPFTHYQNGKPALIPNRPLSAVYVRCVQAHRVQMTGFEGLWGYDFIAPTWEASLVLPGDSAQRVSMTAWKGGTPQETIHYHCVHTHNQHLGLASAVCTLEENTDPSIALFAPQQIEITLDIRLGIQRLAIQRETQQVVLALRSRRE